MIPRVCGCIRRLLCCCCCCCGCCNSSKRHNRGVSRPHHHHHQQSQYHRFVGRRYLHNNHHHNHGNSSCWRNPFVVFLVTFCAIGSVRFRKADDRIRAAQFLKQHHIIRPSGVAAVVRGGGGKQQHGLRPTPRSASNSSSTTTNRTSTIRRNSTSETISTTDTNIRMPTWSPSLLSRQSLEYIPIEEGIIPHGTYRYRKFVAVRQRAAQQRRQQQQHQTGEGIAEEEKEKEEEEEPISILEWAQTLSSAVDATTTTASTTTEAEDGSVAANLDFIDQFVQTIANVPYKAIYFEMPPVASGHPSSAMRRNMEFVIVDAPNLDAFATGRPDRYAFEEHFRSASCSSQTSAAAACVFPSLGRDALLIAPKPTPRTTTGSSRDTASSYNSYAHLASFIRASDVSRTQILETWRTAIRRYYNKITATDAASANARRPKQRPSQPKQPIWFSTSGTGISWLHFRIDTRPKYYTYEPYKIYPTTNNVAEENDEEEDEEDDEDSDDEDVQEQEPVSVSTSQQPQEQQEKHKILDPSPASTEARVQQVVAGTSQANVLSSTIALDANQVDGNGGLRINSTDGNLEVAVKVAEGDGESGNGGGYTMPATTTRTTTMMMTNANDKRQQQQQQQLRTRQHRQPLPGQIIATTEANPSKSSSKDEDGNAIQISTGNTTRTSIERPNEMEEGEKDAHSHPDRRVVNNAFKDESRNADNYQRPENVNRDRDHDHDTTPTRVAN